MTDTATTKRIVTIVDKATKGINAAMATATKTINDLQAMVATSEDLAFGIETASDKLAGIEAATVASLRDAKADLAIRIKENADLVLTGMLKAGNLVRITGSELGDLRNELEQTKQGNDAELGKAVGIAVSRAEATAKLTAAELSSQGAIASAELKAKNEALRSEVAFLQKSVSTLEANAARELKARVDIAANTAQATINVGTSK